METQVIKTSAGEFFEVPAGKLVSAPAGVDHPQGWIAKPAYIDNHCHILPTGLDLLKLNLRDCQTPDDVLQAVAERHRANSEGWLLAVQYDQTKFAGAIHLNRHQLDAISSTQPILLRHSNGHASVANSAALAAAGITKDTEDPKGGTFVRDASGELTGVLLERAHEVVTSSAPDPSLEEMVEAILRAGSLLASFGFTSASDMMTGRWNLAKELEAYRIASERGCAIRMGLCLQWSSVLGPRGIDPGLLGELTRAMNPDICQIEALKIFADGAIGSATAAIHSTYKTTGEKGTLIYSPEKLTEMIRKATEAEWSVIIHSIGDRSTDHVMDSIEASGNPASHRIEHVMILSDAQIERLKSLGCSVTLQPEFLYRFGHAYRSQLQDDVWPDLIRARSLLDAGIPISASTDRPIVIGLPEVGIDSLVNRPAGFTPAEALTPDEAELCWTEWAARDCLRGGQLGRLEDGFFADYRLIDEAGTLQQVYRGGEAVWTRPS